MFHCTVGDDYIVLQQSEARSIIAKLSGSMSEALSYNMRDFTGGSQSRRRNERAIVGQLRAMRESDPEAFRKAYVFRSEWGEAAIPTFLALLDGYRRHTFFVDCEEIDRWATYSADPSLMPSYEVPERLSLLIVSRQPVRFWRYTVTASIDIPVPTIEHVFGTTRRFILITKLLKVVFSPDGVEVMQL